MQRPVRVQLQHQVQWGQARLLCSIEVFAVCGLVIIPPPTLLTNRRLSDGGGPTPLYSSRTQRICIADMCEQP